MDEGILLKYLQGTCTSQEALDVESWSKEKPENRKLLEQLYYIQFVGDRVSAMDAVDTEASLKKLNDRIKANDRLKRPSSFSWRRLIIPAAAFLTGIFLSGALLLRQNAGSAEDFVIMTADGQRAQTELPDGSKVWLNSSTRLTYHSPKKKSGRIADLSGEAYFEVSHDADAPFTVNCNGIKTNVLGTKFNVRAKEDENCIVTTLFQGKVSMSTPEMKGSGLILSPGQTLKVDKKSYEAKLYQYSRPDDMILWIKGKIPFKQNSLSEITDLLSKLYDINFVFEDESLKNEKFTGEFSTDDEPEEIMDILAHTYYFAYTISGRTITISKK